MQVVSFYLNKHLLTSIIYLSMVFSPKYMGGDFAIPSYSWAISFNFFNLGGNYHLGGTSNYLGGINPDAFLILMLLDFRNFSLWSLIWFILVIANSLIRFSSTQFVFKSLKSEVSGVSSVLMYMCHVDRHFYR